MLFIVIFVDGLMSEDARLVEFVKQPPVEGVPQNPVKNITPITRASISNVITDFSTYHTTFECCSFAVEGIGNTSQMCLEIPTPMTLNADNEVVMYDPSAWNPDWSESDGMYKIGDTASAELKAII